MDDLEHLSVDGLEEVLRTAARSRARNASYYYKQNASVERLMLFAEELMGHHRAPQRQTAMGLVLGLSRSQEQAITLARRGLRDRSFVVRSNAVLAYAYSLRRDLIPELLPLATDPDEKAGDMARGAIRAIQGANHHLLFAPEVASPNVIVTWIVNPGDG